MKTMTSTSDINEIIDMTDIKFPSEPLNVDCGQWIMDHPDCDTVYEQPSNARMITVFAYATSKKGNRPLHTYRDRELTGKKILKGVSIDGIRKFI